MNRIGRVLIVTGSVALVLPPAALLFGLGIGPVEASLDRVLTAAIARRQDLWNLWQVGMGLLASAGGLIFLGSGFLLVKLENATSGSKSLPSASRGAAFSSDTQAAGTR